jgi:hypothetical protein
MPDVCSIRGTIFELVHIIMLITVILWLVLCGPGFARNAPLAPSDTLKVKIIKFIPDMNIKHLGQPAGYRSD